MAGSAIKAGEAFVRFFVDEKDMKKGLKSVQADLKKFSRAAAVVGAAFTAAGGAMGVFLSKAANAASDAAVAGRALVNVFEGQTDAPRAFARELAKSIGESRFTLEKALVTFQSFFRGVGFGSKEAGKLSEELITLSRDFAAFHNISNDDAQQRFISGLSGSAEVLDRYGINLKSAAINQQLLAMGIEETTATANENDKVIARVALLMEGMAQQGAIGKAASELHTFAGQMRASGNAAKDFMVAVGTSLLPIGEKIAASFVAATKAVTSLFVVFPLLSVVVAALAVTVGTMGVVMLVAALATLALAKAMDVYADRAKLATARTWAQTKATAAYSAVAAKLPRTMKTVSGAGGGVVSLFLMLGRGLMFAAAAVKFLAIGFLALSAPILAIGAAIAVVVGFVILVAKEFGILAVIMDTMKALWKGLIDTLAALAGAFRDLAGWASKSISSMIDSLGAFGRATKKTWKLTKEGMDVVGDGFSDLMGLFKRNKSTQVEVEVKVKTEEEQREDIKKNDREVELAEKVHDLRIAGIKDREKRELAAIEVKYAREISAAKKAGDTTKKLELARLIELQNARDEFHQHDIRAFLSNQTQIKRLRIQLTKKGLSQTLALLKDSLAKELIAATGNQTLIDQINEKFRLKRIVATRAAAKQAAEYELSITQRIQGLITAGIEDRLDRELEMIKNRYDAEIALAKAAGKDITRLQKAQQLEEYRATKAARDRKREERVAKEKESQDAQQGFKDDLARLDIELETPPGLQRDLALIEQSRKEAIRDAGGDTAQEKLINEKAAKQVELAQQQAQLGGEGATAVGSFSGAQIAAFGAGVPSQRNEERELLEKQLRKQEEANRLLEQIEKNRGAA